MIAEDTKLIMTRLKIYLEIYNLISPRLYTQE
jgi:hypothetical protein